MNYNIQFQEIIEHFKSELNPNKREFIQQIMNLASKLNLQVFLIPHGFYQLCSKSIEELFLLKYELSVISMNLLELLMSFKDMGKSQFIINYITYNFI